jgi:hypothetical protein
MTTREWEQFFRELENKYGVKLAVKVNDNRQTMLSVKWEPKLTKISLHRMFLKAPRTIMDELSCYIRRKTSIVSKEIKAFIEKNLIRLDYSHLVDPKRLKPVGEVYDLKAVYAKLNRYYFKDSLDLAITWFGNVDIKNRARVSLGLYYDSMKLIKIHKLLDRKYVPPYVIEFVVFHEMLHAVCPAYIDEKGIHRVHNKEFKKLEESFYCYEKAKNWIKQHQPKFFLLHEVKKQKEKKQEVKKQEEKNGRTQQVGKYQTSQGKSRRTKRQAVHSRI